MPLLNTLGGGSARGFGGVGGASTPPPVNTVAPAITGGEYSGGTLTCSTGTWTSDETISYSYQWYNNTDGILTGETSNTYSPDADDIGDTLYCQVTATVLGAISASADSNDTGVIALRDATAFEGPGTFTFTVPSGVTNVSVVAVGGGGGGHPSTSCGGGGGGLGYKNNYPVTPGQGITVVVGNGGNTGNGGNNSYFKATNVVRGTGGTGGPAGGQGGGYLGDGGGSGGQARAGANNPGGGGAGGYSGNGGQSQSGNQFQGDATPGAGGGGGGGTQATPGPYSTGGGGGVGILGEGPSGAGGQGGQNTFASVGKGGSGGDPGTNPGGPGGGGRGGAAGGGAGSHHYGGSQAIGARGAVRIVWPGASRQFPSTDVGN